MECQDLLGMMRSISEGTPAYMANRSLFGLFNSELEPIRVCVQLLISIGERVLLGAESSIRPA
jgi:hypothetical protein